MKNSKLKFKNQADKASMKFALLDCSRDDLVLLYLCVHFEVVVCT